MSRAFVISIFIIPLALNAQEWSEPVKLPEPINVNARSLFPFITHDNSRLYFASNRDFSATEDIYYSDWDGLKWGEAIRLGPNINTMQLEHSPSVTADGKTLYFVRYTTRHSYDIFYSTWDDTGWGRAINIGPPINTDHMEWSCCISPGGDTLFFDCAHYLEMYPPDLCFSVKTDTGWSYPELIFKDYEGNSGWENAPTYFAKTKTIYFHRLGNSAWERDIWCTTANLQNWTQPINLSTPINTPEAEMTPSISADGNTLYFSRMYITPPYNESPKIYVTHRIIDRVNTKQQDNSISIVVRCYPNPFNSHINIYYSNIHQIGPIDVIIYNLNGKEVNKLTNELVRNSELRLVWDGTDNKGFQVTSGLYFCQVMVDGKLIRIIKLIRLN